MIKQTYVPYQLTFYSRLLTESIKYLNEADLYEVAANVYKLIIPIHEKAHDYDSLMKCYGELRGIQETWLFIISMCIYF